MGTHRFGGFQKNTFKIALPLNANIFMKEQVLNNYEYMVEMPERSHKHINSEN